jgi:hypothetical protein
MKLTELKALLRAHPDSKPRFVLPDGDTIPEHFHITEVGHVAKRFIDCGGTVHDARETCLLQTWVSDADPDHRLDAATFVKILDLGQAVLPGEGLEVEVEYDCCVTAQYPLARAEVVDGRIDFQLEARHTDCLAKERCGIDEGGCGCAERAEAESTCC